MALPPTEPGSETAPHAGTDAGRQAEPAAGTVRTVPVPPWRRTRPARPVAPPKVPLTLDRIVAAGLRIADAEGLEALTMRRLAHEFETGAARLYAHVASKEELLQLMLDEIAAEIEVPEPDPGSWQDQVKQVAREIYRVFCAHADVASVALGTIPTGPHLLRVTEGMLAIILAGGVPPQLAGWTVDRLWLYVSSDAYEGHLFIARQRDSGLPVADFADQFLRQLREFYMALPAEWYPMTNHHAATLTTGGGDERFEFGLDLLLSGLTARLARDH